MSKLKWDETGKRFYETGIKRGVVYPQSADGTYPKGYAWNGLTSVTESPSGAESNPIYADDIKYLDLRSTEEFGGTIEAYTYPDEFGVCDGTATPEGAPGVIVHQQSRKPFGLTYVTTVGNDTQYNDYGYKLHLIWNATASPSEKNFQTINDSPEAIAFSWEFTTTPVDITGYDNYKPSAQMTIDTTKLDEKGKTALTALLDKLYGTESEEASLPTPSEVLDMFTKAA